MESVQTKQESPSADRTEAANIAQLRRATHFEVSPVQDGANPSASQALDRWLAGKMLAAIGRPPIAIVLWDGQEIGNSAAPRAKVKLESRSALFRLALDPDVQFGELYAAGQLSVSGNLVELLEILYRAIERSRLGPLARLRFHWRNRGRRKSLADSRHNVHHHYDIGNDFYRLWLDEDMLYTCAYFVSPDQSLEQAQRAKMDYVCRKLRLRPGENVVEAGCGWGSLAIHMARHYGATVTAYNVSREQVECARQRARALGLEGKVTFVLDDYRNIAGQFDAFVSVGMLEHVGREHYSGLGQVIDRCLGPHGRGLLHSIGRDRPGGLNGWIRRRIFPGAYPPSPREMLSVIEPYRLSVLDLENLRPHYARTVEHWLSRFEKNADRIGRQFGEQFVRTWRLYLSGSIAAFTTGSLQLYQLLFARPECGLLPETRADIYATEPGR